MIGKCLFNINVYKNLDFMIKALDMTVNLHEICVHTWMFEIPIYNLIGLDVYEFNVPSTDIYLKSGIPAEVLIPAPVWKTVYLDSLIQLARTEIFSFKTSEDSKT